MTWRKRSHTAQLCLPSSCGWVCCSLTLFCACVYKNSAAGVGVFWIIVGVKTMGITGGAFKNCAAVDTTLAGLCTDAQTLMIFSIVTGALRESLVCGLLCIVLIFAFFQ